MVEIEINGAKVSVPSGSMVMHAAEKAGLYIPHFCYHKKLSIAANCRMCLVEIEKAPKPMPACATPVTQGMVVRTKSDKAVAAQKSVMEFMLINHPLDCPICDQGGECQLQDLAMGYGGCQSRYTEEKRIVMHKQVGPLISMEEMSRCIHCTRCVRFGQEIAGEMELGMSHRGEHSEIETFLGKTIDSELSGNMVDICPVGALTNKPFRYKARTWELTRRKTISSHDSTGSNMIAQVFRDQIVRVVPHENEAINECWLADRDRFSYLGVHDKHRLMQPMQKINGQWQTVSWNDALLFIASQLQQIKTTYGDQSLLSLASPHSTLEELFLMKQLTNALGSTQTDVRLRQIDKNHQPIAGTAHWLGMSIHQLSQLKVAWVIGSNLRKDHPLFAQRIRQAVKKGAKIHTLVPKSQHPTQWAMPLASEWQADSQTWVQVLESVVAAVAAQLNQTSPVDVAYDVQAEQLAKSLLQDHGEHKALLLGNMMAHHQHASYLLALANWLAKACQLKLGYLTEAANTVGAHLMNFLPSGTASPVKAALLVHTDVKHDVYQRDDLAHADLVVSFNPFQVNQDIAHVMLPIATSFETEGTFVNAEGRVQSFDPVIKPVGETRPLWKIVRALAHQLNLQIDHPIFNVSQTKTILATALPEQRTQVLSSSLSNEAKVSIDAKPQVASVYQEPCVASIYQLDGLCRHSSALQATRDAHLSNTISKVE